MKCIAILSIILFAIACVAGVFIGIATDRCFCRYGYPEWMRPYMNPVNWSIRHFVKALANRDADALVQHVCLLFERHYPIPKIDFCRPGVHKDGDVASRAKFCEWK